MKRQIIDFGQMPLQYTVCWQNECPNAGECLRRQCALHLPSDRLVAPSVNPNAVDWASGNCNMFRSTAPVVNAWGLKHIYDNVPKNTATMLYKRVTALFSKNLYYQYYNCKKPITPEHQELISAEFRAMGIDTPVAFERYEEAVNW